LEQDIKAMDACFDKIPVRAGEVWIVPGGLPHAIGPGLLVMEVMEPTDLVVRCEFERDGIAVPPEARFMGRDPDFALRIFDHSAFPPERIFEECRVTPEVIYEDGAALVELLIGGRQTECFTERRVTVTGDTELKSDGRMTVGVVVRGSGVISSGRDALTARRGLKFLTAAAAETLRINPTSGESVQILLCS
jgi:mannose-6-phosphate isomerase